MNRFRAPQKTPESTKKKKPIPEFQKILKRLPKPEAPPEEKEPGWYSWSEITKKELKGWLHLCQYTIPEGAKELGIAQGTLAGMLQGKQRIPARISRLIRDFQKELSADKKWLTRPERPQRKVWFIARSKEGDAYRRESECYGLKMQDLLMWRFWSRAQVRMRNQIVKARETGKSIPYTSAWDRIPIDKGIGCIVCHRPTGWYAKGDGHAKFHMNRTQAMKTLASMLGHRFEDHEPISGVIKPRVVDVDEFMRRELRYLSEKRSDS